MMSTASGTPDHKRLTARGRGLRTIRTRLLMASVATILLAATAISGASIVTSLRNRQREAIDRLELVAELRGVEIDEWIKEVQNTIARSLRDAPGHRFEESNVAAAVTRLLDNPADSDEYTEAHGLLAYNFDLWLQQAPQFEAVSFVDRDGKVLVSTDPATEGQAVADQAYFQLGTTGSYLAPVSYSVPQGRPLTFVSRPVLDARGRLLGVLVGSVDASTLERLMRLREQASLGDTGESYLVSDQRTMLTNSRFAEAGTIVNTQGVASAMKGQERKEGAGRYDVASAALPGASGAYYNYVNTPVIGVYRWLPGLHVVLAVEQTRAEVFSAVNKVTLLNGVVALISTMVAGGVSLLIARGIGNRLGALAQTASEIAGGDLEQTARVEGRDEIGALAEAFNTMTARLRSLIGTLEERVAERTSDLEQRSAYLEASAQVAHAASSILDADELIQEVVNLVGDRFGLYHVGLFLIDEMGEWAELRAGTGEAGQRMLAEGHRLRIGGESMIGQCVVQSEARVAMDVGEEAVRRENPLLPKTRSEAALPLQSRGRVFGAMTVQSSQPAAFDDYAVTVLQAMADQVAVALDNAYLFAEAQSAVQAARRASGEASRRAWAQLLRAQPVAGYHCDDRGVVSADSIWRPEMDKAVREGHPVRGRPEDPSSGDGTRRPLAVPIAVAGEVIGALDTYKPSDAGPWTDEEIGTLESLAEQLGLSLESARLFEETQRALSETEMLYRAGEAIGAAASPDEILRAITHHVLAPPVDRCVLALADPATPSDQPVVVVEAAWEPGVEEPPWIGDRWSVHRRQGALQLPFLGAVLGAARAGGEGPSRCVFSDVTTATRLDGLSRHTLGVRLGVRAAAAIPLVAGERALGLLLIQSTDEPYEFSEREIRLYLTLADQAAVALDGMRLLEETRRRAQRERLTAEITSHVWSSADVDTILRTAVGELGRSLQASDAWIELESGDGDRTSKGGRRVDDSLRVLSGGDEDGFLSREPARGGGSS